MKKHNRAVTLLEMTIVMALLSIISVLIITFCDLAKNYTLSISSDEAAYSDMDEIKEMFELWSTSLDKKDVTIYVYDNKLGSNYNALSYSLIFYDFDGEKALYGSCPSEEGEIDDREILYNGTSEIESIKFDYIKNENNGFYCLTMNVSYSYYKKNASAEKIIKNRTFLKTIRCATVAKGD